MSLAKKNNLFDYIINNPMARLWRSTAGKGGFPIENYSEIGWLALQALLNPFMAEPASLKIYIYEKSFSKEKEKKFIDVVKNMSLISFINPLNYFLGIANAYKAAMTTLLDNTLFTPPIGKSNKITLRRVTMFAVCLPATVITTFAGLPRELLKKEKDNQKREGVILRASSREKDELTEDLLGNNPTTPLPKRMSTLVLAEHRHSQNPDRPSTTTSNVDITPASSPQPFKGCAHLDLRLAKHRNSKAIYEAVGVTSSADIRSQNNTGNLDAAAPPSALNTSPSNAALNDAAPTKPEIASAHSNETAPAPSDAQVPSTPRPSSGPGH